MFYICYDGSRYHGWESKKDVDTIEGRIEAVFTKMTGVEVRLNGAGRTDAGVHAKGMVASGRLDTDKTPEEIKEYANHYLPDDICIDHVKVAADRFHARLNAKGKRYQYTCYIGKEKPVFDRAYTWVLPDWIKGKTQILDIGNMKKAAAYLVGKHDFKSFCGNNKMKKSTVREIYHIDIEESDGYLYMRFHGNGFLQNMVRILAGTLLEVGCGKIMPSDISGILAAKDRTKAGVTAPPHGLCLMEVEY